MYPHLFVKPYLSGINSNRKTNGTVRVEHEKLLGGNRGATRPRPPLPVILGPRPKNVLFGPKIGV